MKRNAVVRIILFSLMILIFSGILAAGLLLRNYGYRISSKGHENASVSTVPEPIHSDHSVDQNSGGSDTATPAVPSETSASSEHHEESSRHDHAVPSQRIDELNIDWACGSITIRPGDTQELLLEETGSDYPMVTKVSGNKLTIQFPKNSLSLLNTLRKDLTITVPKNWVCHELEIDCASADVDITDISIENLSLDSASGKCTLTNCSVRAMSVETASGDVTFTGTLDTLNCDSASAKLHLTVDNCPRSIDVDTASGNLVLTLPEECGFTASLDALSGRFSSEFPTTTDNGHHLYGDGSCKIRMNSMSGDIQIKKG